MCVAHESHYTGALRRRSGLIVQGPMQTCSYSIYVVTIKGGRCVDSSTAPCIPFCNEQTTINVMGKAYCQ